MDIHVARQPIFDRRQNVFAYELLYRRSNASNAFDNTQADVASSNVIVDSFLSIGIDSLTGGKRAFVNFTGNLLEREVATLFPKDILVIEVLETVSVNPQIVEKCKTLKHLGYKIALDDFVMSNEIVPLVALADIIKIDFRLMNPDQIRLIVRSLKRPGLRFLAEKVETSEHFNIAWELGFHYFQGYFFSKPTIISEQGLRPLPINYIRLIQEANDPDISFHRIARIIQRDVALSYNLLWMVNTVGYGYTMKIKTVQHALVAIGEVEMRKWISLIAMMGINENQPKELLYSSLIRARFAEKLAGGAQPQYPGNLLFMMGLFSLMESIMQRPFEKIFKEVRVEQPIQDALEKDSGALAPFMRLVIAQERGYWDQVETLCAVLRVEEDWVASMYIEAIKWCDALLNPIQLH